MKLIELTRGRFARVDDSAYKKLSKIKWCCTTNGYAYNRKSGYMHRYIMNPKENLEVDHINGDKLDNRKSNLRFCSRVQNSYNQPTRADNKSGYRGVVYMPYPGRKKRWKAYIGHGGKQITIGYFNTKSMAIKARKDKARELFGEYAYE